MDKKIEEFVWNKERLHNDTLNGKSRGVSR